MYGIGRRVQLDFGDAARNCASAGSSIAEWKACEVGTRLLRMPGLRQRRAGAAIAVVGPASDARARAVVTARSTPPPRNGCNCAGSASTASIAPAGSCCISRPRARDQRERVRSDNTPARQAATYSPTLWPIIASGCTPQGIQSWRASAYSTTNSAGWVSAVSRQLARRLLVLVRARDRARSRRSQPSCGASSRRAASTPRGRPARLVQAARPCRRTARPGRGTGRPRAAMPPRTPARRRRTAAQRRRAAPAWLRRRPPRGGAAAARGPACSV